MTNTQSSTEVLKIDTRGRVRTPKAKQAEILAGYESSGMTGQQFAAYVGVKYSTLMSWTGKARKASRASQEIKPSGISWVEAVVGDAGSRAQEGLRVQIGAAVEVRVATTRQAELAAEIIRCLGVTREC